MDRYDLETAFFKQLKALTFDGSTFKPDEVMDPKDIGAWRRGVALVGNPETIGFGNGVYSRVEGLYQIDIYVPRATENALKVLMKTCDAHVTHFFPANGRGLSLTENQTSAAILRRPNTRPFSREGVYLRQIIEIDFQVDIPAAG